MVSGSDFFTGTHSAIVTPFLDAPEENPAIDYASLENLIEWQLTTGISGIVVCGSTGEAATLSTDEKLAVIRRTVEVVRGRVPVTAGTGTNCTYDSVELTKRVKSLGVDAVLAVAPYYNKPTQEGLFQHFKAIAEQGKLPVVVYNIPGRSVVEISAATLGRLAKLSEIAAVKQAVDSASRLLEVQTALDGNAALLAGDDPLTYAVLSVGGHGVISASATVIPEDMVAITTPGLKGDFKSALAAQQQALPRINALFAETNPIPAKAALKLLGKITSDAVRLPLTRATEQTRTELKKRIAA
ncbi:MAG: 4-hydroxy-tetrahydrodipicolinate synthase [Bdellovibrionota bacterium]